MVVLLLQAWSGKERRDTQHGLTDHCSTPGRLCSSPHVSVVATRWAKLPRLLETGQGEGAHTAPDGQATSDSFRVTSFFNWKPVIFLSNLPNPNPLCQVQDQGLVSAKETSPQRLRALSGRRQTSKKARSRSTGWLQLTQKLGTSPPHRDPEFLLLGTNNWQLSNYHK